VAGIFVPLFIDASKEQESPLEQCSGLTWQSGRSSQLMVKEEK